MTDHGSDPELIDSCFKPRERFRRIFLRALSWIEPGALDGVEYIQIIDTIHVREGAQKWDHQPPTQDAFSSWYRPPQEGSGPSITVNVGELYRHIPFILRWTPAVTLAVTGTLAHEVAHHLVRHRGFVFSRDEAHRKLTREQEEEIAERYAFATNKKMLRVWYYRLARRLMSEAAEHHYIQGLLDLKEGKYASAAARFHRAWHLVPEHEFASRAYWYAKELEQSGPEVVPYPPWYSEFLRKRASPGSALRRRK
jgi:hypothetical protein